VLSFFDGADFDSEEEDSDEDEEGFSAGLEDPVSVDVESPPASFLSVVFAAGSLPFERLSVA
jgi:hypothetical protein